MSRSFPYYPPPVVCRFCHGTKRLGFFGGFRKCTRCYDPMNAPYTPVEIKAPPPIVDPEQEEREIFETFDREPPKRYTAPDPMKPGQFVARDPRDEPQIGDRRIVELPQFVPPKFRVDWYGEMRRKYENATTVGWRTATNLGARGVFDFRQDAEDAIMGPKVVGYYEKKETE